MAEKTIKFILTVQMGLDVVSLLNGLLLVDVLQEVCRVLLGNEAAEARTAETGIASDEVRLTHQLFLFL